MTMETINTIMEFLQQDTILSLVIRGTICLTIYAGIVLYFRLQDREEL